jgi:site-specific recombinase XerD
LDWRFKVTETTNKLKQPAQYDFPQAIRSFMGYLEGTAKSFHTVSNYRLDVLAFQKFIEKVYEGSPLRLDQVSRKDIELYGETLKELGLKTNTRRRKILTVTQFLNYLAKRKKVSSEMAQKMPAPHKIERIPFTVSIDELLVKIKRLPDDTLIALRNKVLLSCLAETGCLVSEATRVRFEDHYRATAGAENFLALGRKVQRKVPISGELSSLIDQLKERAEIASEQPLPWLFLGFNKGGSLNSAISPRGVELLVKHLAPALGSSLITPRTFRHSVIVKWFSEGKSQNDMQTLLGLKTPYAFKSYESLIPKNQPTS